MTFALALLAGVLNFILNFGPLIALVPAVLVAMRQGLMTALLIAGLYILVQVVETNLLTPQIRKTLIRIPPALIFLAQLFMGVLTGSCGLLLATPLVVILMVLVRGTVPKKSRSMMDKLFFDSWESLMRTFLITVMAYLLLIVLLRSFGKRTLSKMNAFDLIVTIALGSTLATVILNKNVALLDGILAFFLLIFLQFLITSISVRSRRFSHLVKSTPTLLVYKGRLLRQPMKRERIDEDEIHALLREKGLDRLEAADAIVLETDGSLTLIQKLQDETSPVLRELLQAENHP